MGSEGSSGVIVHVTGFKKFYGVAHNPTETIVSNLGQFMEREGLPKGLVLGSCTVLEAAGQGILAPLNQIFESGRSSGFSKSERVIFLHLGANGSARKFAIEQLALHLGANGSARKFAIEQLAVNEATFLCPDEMGWKPQKVPIVSSDGDISKMRKTSLPVNEITDALARKGYDVVPSDEPDKFVCNFVYYHSLRYAEENGLKSLFVHVPLFYTIDEETQMQFVSSLLEVLASLN